MGQDFWADGYALTVDVIEKLLRHYQQGLSRRQLKPDEIFAPETLESYKISLGSPTWAAAQLS
jgi:4,5-dihydroxyphthalate decarboxylase